MSTWNREKSRAHGPKDASPFRLADLPPEIRILIFEEHLKWRIKRIASHIKLGKKFSTKQETGTPSLIKALRPNSTLYSEALDVYFDLSTLRISINNEQRVKYLPRQITERARSLELWYGVKMGGYAWGLELVPCFPINILFRCSNVRQICITTTAWQIELGKRSTAIATMRHMVKQSVLQLPRLQILTLEMPKVADVDEFIFPMDNAMGITHHTIFPRRGMTQTNLSITWDAGKERALTWTDDTHWRSIPWNNVDFLYVGISKFHMLCFWMPMRLQFLGLNPRPLFLSCADEKCDCATPGQDWHLDQERRLTSTLHGSFGAPLL